MAEYEIICGDALVEMPKLIQRGVKADFCLVDPPFNVRDEKWDKFGSKETFAEFTGQWLQDAYSITGLVACFFPDLYVPLLREVAARLDIPYRRALVWHKPPGSQYNGASLDGFWYDFEMIQVFGKPAKSTNVATRFGVMSHRTIINGFHRCQKPVELLTELIEAYCPAGGTILDPFMGSGSSGMASALTGRSFIGIEENADYCAVAEARIKRAQGIPADIPRIVRADRTGPLFDAIA